MAQRVGEQLPQWQLYQAPQGRGREAKAFGRTSGREALLQVLDEAIHGGTFGAKIGTIIKDADPPVAIRIRRS